MISLNPHNSSVRRVELALFYRRKTEAERRKVLVKVTQVGFEVRLSL